MLQGFRTKGLFAVTLAALVAFGVLVGLGNWQWQRKVWKEELIDTITKRAAAEPLQPDRWSSLDCRPVHEIGLGPSCEFTTVRLLGQFDHGGERHIFTNVPKKGGAPGGPGYWVFTPFDIAGGKGRIYVNRGFVPEARKDPATRPEGQTHGEVEIIGQLRTAEQRGLFTGASNQATNVWFLRDPRELLDASHAGADALAPWQAREGGPGGLDFYIDQISPTPAGGLPSPRAAVIELPNRHLEYALTWWGLAVTLVGVYVAFIASRLRARGPQRL